MRPNSEEWSKGQSDSEPFYFTGTEKLRDRYQMRIDKGGEYVGVSRRLVVTPPSECR